MMSKVPAPRESPPSGVRGPGFQARIKGAAIADLVQMECLAGSRRAVRVTSGEHAGYLYFRGGAVVHAVTRSLAGEAAAMEMLAWDEGTFEPSEREWPPAESIGCSWQSLLIRSAQARDEGGAGRPAAAPLAVAGHGVLADDFDLFLRMNADGDQVAGHGGTHAFADVAAYALRLAQLIGEGLGVDRFFALEATFKEGRCFIVLEDGGDVVALKPKPAADASALRAHLRL